jgi:hypothetical protein
VDVPDDIDSMLYDNCRAVGAPADPGHCLLSRSVGDCFDSAAGAVPIIIKHTDCALLDTAWPL